ncbi:MAG TPA: hypothetical protein VGO86_04355 [Candidatus Dormibacteraeota bacterium]
MIFTIVSAFILVATIALVGNTQVLFVNVNRADAVALLAAQAGASTISHDALYDPTNERIALDQGLAVIQCEKAGHQQPFIVDVHCTTNGNAVIATVTEQVEMPFPLLNGTETVTATRTARPAFGGTTSGGF